MTENHETESADDAFAEAQKVQLLRQKIHTYARGAVECGGVDRDWVNQRLNRIGADLVTGDVQYQINTPIIGNYGTTIVAPNRVTALAKFNEIVEQIVAKGEIRNRNYGQGVYGVKLNPAAGGAQFFSGPEDVVSEESPFQTLEAVRAAIRSMIKDAVVEQGWGHYHAERQLEELGLEPLPKLVSRTVQVPVSGMASLHISVYENADDADVQAVTATLMGRMSQVIVSPDEIGSVLSPRPDATLGMTLVDDDDDDEDNDDDSYGDDPF